jgi:hypothetical protein
MILMLVGECLFELVFLKSQISSDRTAVFAVSQCVRRTIAINGDSAWGGARFVQLEI